MPAPTFSFASVQACHSWNVSSEPVFAFSTVPNVEDAENFSFCGPEPVNLIVDVPGAKVPLATSKSAWVTVIVEEFPETVPVYGLSILILAAWAGESIRQSLLVSPSKMTSWPAVGTASPLQFSAVVHLLSAPPPSQYRTPLKLILMLFPESTHPVPPSIARPLDASMSLKSMYRTVSVPVSLSRVW